MTSAVRPCLVFALAAGLLAGPEAAPAQVPARPRTAVRAAPAKPRAPAQAEPAAFNRAIDGLPQERWRTIAPARIGPVWDLLDRLIATRLNAGLSLDSLNAELATLHGYEAPAPGQGERFGGGMYWSEMPRELPSWFVGGVPQLGDDHVLALYNIGLGAAGRATLFARSGEGWSVASRIQATLPLSLTPVPAPPGFFGVLAVERFTGADRSECTVSLWRVASGTFRRDRVLPGTYWDCETGVTDTAAFLGYAQMSQVLNTGVLGPRLVSDMSFALGADGRWQVKTRATNPWLHAYERFYRLGGTGAARSMVARPALLRGMSRNVVDDGGDAEGGSGWVLVEDRRGRRRIEMEVTPGGAWRIERIVAEPDSARDEP